MAEKMSAADVAELAYWRKVADWDRKNTIDNSSHRERVEKVRIRALAEEPLAQPAQAVDVGAIREVINYLQDEGNACIATGDELDAQWGSRILSMSRKLTRAISNKKK